MRKTNVDRLVAARNLIAKPDGWCQGSYYRRRGDVFTAFCAVGACEQKNASEATIRALVPESNLVRFNDAPTTTQADVVALFDWAIGIEMAGGL